MARKSKKGRKKSNKASSKKGSITVVVKNKHKHVTGKQNPEPEPPKRKSGLLGWFGKLLKAAALLLPFAHTVQSPQ